MIPTPEDPSYLPTYEAGVAVRAALEGVPIKAIARLLEYPSDVVYNTLVEKRDEGAILALPKADWPPGPKDDRSPVAAQVDGKDLTFALQQHFELTKLEAAFLSALVSADRVEKTKFHHIVENQRLSRSQRPNKLTPTDPKMVDVMICKLRKKLSLVDPAIKINTIWGGGYHMLPPAKALVSAKVAGNAG